MKMTRNNRDDFVSTGETRVPRTGEFFLCPTCDNGKGVVLRQLATSTEPRDYGTGNGGGYTSAPSEIMRPRSTRGRRLTVRQGDNVSTFEGDFDFEVEDLDTYVQVKFSGTVQLYTYRDPSGTLGVGDRVLAPTYNGDTPATVKKLGRGTWKGTTRDITTRLVEEAL